MYQKFLKKERKKEMAAFSDPAELNLETGDNEAIWGTGRTKRDH